MKNTINLMHLKYFCDAVVNNSISEAAKINYVTQSGVSQAIAKLEISLGTQILVHARQKFQVTANGMILFEQAKHIFKAVQNIHDQIQSNQDEVRGTLKFACTNSLGMSFIAPSYERMRNNYPLVNMEMKLGNGNFIRNALKQNEVDLAIVVYDQSFSHFKKQCLHKGVFQLHQSKEAPCHLMENGILVDNKQSLFVEDLLGYFNSTQSPCRVQLELAGWEVVARFAERNIGIGFFPDYILANGRYPNLVPCPISIPKFEYEICAVFNKDAELSRCAKAYLAQFTLE